MADNNTHNDETLHAQNADAAPGASESLDASAAVDSVALPDSNFKNCATPPEPTAAQQPQDHQSESEAPKDVAPVVESSTESEPKTAPPHEAGDSNEKVMTDDSSSEWRGILKVLPLGIKRRVAVLHNHHDGKDKESINPIVLGLLQRLFKHNESVDSVFNSTLLQDLAAFSVSSRGFITFYKTSTTAFTDPVDYIHLRNALIVAPTSTAVSSFTLITSLGSQQSYASAGPSSTEEWFEKIKGVQLETRQNKEDVEKMRENAEYQRVMGLLLSTVTASKSKASAIETPLSEAVVVNESEAVAVVDEQAPAHQEEKETETVPTSETSTEPVKKRFTLMQFLNPGTSSSSHAKQTSASSVSKDAETHENETQATDAVVDKVGENQAVAKASENEKMEVGEDQGDKQKQDKHEVEQSHADVTFQRKSTLLSRIFGSRTASSPRKDKVASEDGAEPTKTQTDEQTQEDVENAPDGEPKKETTEATLSDEDIAVPTPADESTESKEKNEEPAEDVPLSQPEDLNKEESQEQQQHDQQEQKEEKQPTGRFSFISMIRSKSSSKKKAQQASAVVESIAPSTDATTAVVNASDEKIEAPESKTDGMESSAAENSEENQENSVLPVVSPKAEIVDVIEKEDGAEKPNQEQQETSKEHIVHEHGTKSCVPGLKSPQFLAKLMKKKQAAATPPSESINQTSTETALPTSEETEPVVEQTASSDPPQLQPTTSDEPQTSEEASATDKNDTEVKTTIIQEPDAPQTSSANDADATAQTADQEQEHAGQDSPKQGVEEEKKKFRLLGSLFKRHDSHHKKTATADEKQVAAVEKDHGEIQEESKQEVSDEDKQASATTEEEGKVEHVEAKVDEVHVNEKNAASGSKRQSGLFKFRWGGSSNKKGATAIDERKQEEEDALHADTKVVGSISAVEVVDVANEFAEETLKEVASVSDKA